MPKSSEAPGCRSAAIAGGTLIVVALVFMAIGLTMINQDSCSGICETSGFTLLYAGLPISAIFGVGFGELVVAWPLDVTFWVVIGFVVAKFADNRRQNPLAWALATLGLALIYGLVLSQFVEIAI